MTQHAWVLPDQIADVLPRQARTIEAIRGSLLQLFARFGFELVIPPLVEYTDALIATHDEDLSLRTVKWADHVTGKTLAIRADMTPQVARIDAHLLNREGIVRLCYYGSVFHARAAGLLASREPLIIGAEIYGHAGLAADAEVQSLLIEALAQIGLPGVRLDVSHAGIVAAILARQGDVDEALRDTITEALQCKDTALLRTACAGLHADCAAALMALLDLYGDAQVLSRARQELPDWPDISRALDELVALADWDTTGVLQFDLADLSGYAYHTGVMFAAYCDGVPNAIARGGRYDHIGERFGRARAATGFSLDLREITEILPSIARIAAIRAPMRMDAGLQQAVNDLRARGEVVISVPEGEALRVDEFACTRELVELDGQWQIRDLANA